MSKESYPYLTPALVTVAACTLGAYLLWKQSAVIPPAPPSRSNSEAIVRTRTRITDSLVEEKPASAHGKKPLGLSNQDPPHYLQISGHVETSFRELNGSGKTHLCVCNNLHCFSEVSEEAIPPEISESISDITGSEQNETINNYVTPTQLTENSESIKEVTDYEPNETIYNNNDTSSDVPQNIFSKNEIPDHELNGAINNNDAITVSHLLQTSGSKSETAHFKQNEVIAYNTFAVQDSSLPSGTTIETIEFESNAAIKNRTAKQTVGEEYISIKDITWPDLSEEFGLIDKVPDRTINDSTVAAIDLPKSSGPEVEKPDLETKLIPSVMNENSGSTNDVTAHETNENLNSNNVTPLDLHQASKSGNEVTTQDLHQTSGSKSEVTQQGLPKNSESENEGNDVESNNNAIDNAVTLQDMRQNLGNENDVSHTDDIQKVLGFLGSNSHLGEEDLSRMVSNKKQWRRNPMYLALREGNLPVVQSLLRLGAPIDFTDRQGQFPIHLAAASGNVELLNTLVQWGGSLSSKDMFGYTPFHRAALAGQTETIKWLYERGGGFLKETSWAGWTALHLAVMNGHYCTSDQLLKFGANVNAKDKDGWTPMYLAKLYKRYEVMKLLESWGGIL
ncbi:uncharacterized protein [Halyomorpha halys]|uniref:uncharacterized protein isoform X2 n=1 Tax=Halyomorpha halys TaxID=286706 RepID=UPI0006D4D908|nr:ankyrin-1-like isoform X1 [Halyomorpha halys]